MNPRLAALATDPGFRAARYALALLLGAICGAVLAIHKQPERPAASAPASTTVAVNGTDTTAQEVDALLYRTLREISDYRIDAALSEIDYPGRNDLAVVTFDQVYTSSNLDSQMRKRLDWIREGDGWHIIHEGAA